MVVVNDATVKGGSYYPLTVSEKEYKPHINVHCSVGQEAFTSTGDRTRARTSVCLCRYVVNCLAKLRDKCNIFETVESGGAALPHQANVSLLETRTHRDLTNRTRYSPIKSTSVVYSITWY
jgi:hypothetical protein